MSVRSRYSLTSYRNFRATSRQRTQSKKCRNCEHWITAVPDLQEASVRQQQPQENKSILRRFGEYIARNQAAMKAAGETTLMEDLAEMGKKMFNGLGSLGEEELEKISGRSQRATRK